MGGGRPAGFHGGGRFLLFSDKLRVRGWASEGGGCSAGWKSNCLCYCRDKNVWQKDSWMQKVVKSVPRMTRFKFAVDSAFAVPPMLLSNTKAVGSVFESSLLFLVVQSYHLGSCSHGGDAQSQRFQC